MLFSSVVDYKYDILVQYNAYIVSTVDADGLVL